MDQVSKSERRTSKGGRGGRAATDLLRGADSTDDRVALPEELVDDVDGDEAAGSGDEDLQVERQVASKLGESDEMDDDDRRPRRSESQADEPWSLWGELTWCWTT